MPMARFFLIALLCATGLFANLPRPVMAQQSVEFEPAACMFELPAGVVEGRDVDCGWLRVPERHARPDGTSIRLAVAIIRTKVVNPALDPLVMLQGGPGGSTIDTYMQVIFAPGSRLNNLNRDIILFDQRGTLYSEPSLICNEQFDLVEQTIERRLTYEEAERLSLEASNACFRRLAAEGVDLSAYNSVQNAADIAALARALGYRQINLYGVSYGTLLAQHVMRDHPGILRSVILDAVVPTNVNYITEAPRAEDRAYTELFTACAADDGCRAAYPNLEQTFFDTIERLNREPARVAITDDETNRTYNAVLDGDSFGSVVFQLLYATSFLPALPRIIDDASRDDFRVLARVLPLIVFDRTFSLGMHYTVICAEDADFTLADAQLNDLRPSVARDGERGMAGYLTRCEQLDVAALGPVVDEPVRSDVPTLVLSGRFDPITPPAFGDMVAQSLSRAYVYAFPNTGHAAVGSSPCADSLLIDFLANPLAEPDAACVAASRSPVFVSPSTVALTPVTFALASLDPGGLLPFGTFLLALMLLLSAWMIWPIAWIIQKVRRESTPPRRTGTTAARGLMILTGISGIAFVAAALASITQMVLANDATIFYGLPRTQLLTATVWITILGAIGMAVCAGLALRNQWWSGLGRAYYVVLALAAVGCAASLGWMGIY